MDFYYHGKAEAEHLFKSYTMNNGISEGIKIAVSFLMTI